MSKNIHMLAIGAAVQDVFLEGSIFKPQKEDDGYVEEFKLGTKNEVENVVHSTGGGATNASVTFSRFGLHSAYLGCIGDDVAGQAVLNDLHKENVDTALVKQSKKLGTGYSLLLLAPNGERTILTYRGASGSVEVTEKDFHGQKPDWIYVSSLSGDFESLKHIVDFASKHEIELAVNPGKKELANHKEFRKLLPHFSILSVNKEEMEQLFGTGDMHSLLKEANYFTHYVVVTDGPKGCWVADREHIYKAGMYDDVRVVDRAGAGDAFCSGFVASLASGSSVVEAITYGSANSTSVVGQIGAKAGILKGDAKLHKMPITITAL